MREPRSDMREPLNPQHIEEAIASLAGIVRCLKVMTSTYQAIERSIQQEHQAVRDHNLVQLEEIVDTKIKHSQKIEIFFKELQAYSERLFTWIIEHRDSNQALTLEFTRTGMKTACAELGVFIKHSSYKTKVYEHLKKELLNYLELFFQSVELVKPKIELNDLVVSRLLESHRESYSFWYRMAHEGSTPYDASGKLRGYSEQSLSQLSVKA